MVAKIDYDALLAANREARDKGTITPDVYDKEARKLRRMRRKANQGLSKKKAKTQKTIEGGKKGTSSGRKKRTRKKKTKISIPMEMILEESRAAFKKAKVKKIKKVELGRPFHGFSTAAMKSVKEGNPEMNVGEMMIDKFKSRWAKLPTVYTEVEQGNQIIFYVGEIEEKKK